MSFFLPQTARSIQDFMNRIVKTWEDATPEARASGQLINPDEPIVLRVPNPAWVEGEDGPYMPDDEGNETHFYFHVESHGGGADLDEDGRECGHDGAMLSGMEIDLNEFWCNGRRRQGVKK